MVRVSGSFTQILRLWADRQGIGDAHLQNELDILSSREFIEAEEWRAILARAAVLVQNDAVGLQIGAEVRIEHVGVLGYLVLHSESLADALETYILCEQHFYGVNFAELTHGSDLWTLAWPDQLGDRNSLFVQVAFAVLVTFMRQRFPGQVDLWRVSMTGKAPGNIQVFEGFFDCPVHFDSVRPSLSFNAQTIHDPPRGQLPAEFHSMRRQQMDAFSSVVLGDDPFLRRLQSALLKLIPEGGATLPATATELHCSARTLQRQLARNNLSFQTVLDAVREQLAQRYLHRTTLTLAELPLLLGYSDQSAFTRAFRKWTGKTPGQSRREGSSASRAVSRD